MGKESKLRNYKPGETRQSYPNGDRKYYDRDACPAGLDEYIWQLTLLFEQKMQSLGVTSNAKRPVVYTELYEAVQKDPDLTSLLNRATIHTSGKGEGGRPLVTSGTKVHSIKDLVTAIDRYTLVATIIELYFTTYSSNNDPSINSLVDNFKQLKEQIITAEYYKYLKTSGSRVPVVTTGVPQADKRDRRTREVLDITVNRVYSEKDIEEAFTRFREGHK